MTRRSVMVKCNRHDPLVPVGVLFLPVRQPLTSEQYDAYVRQWADFLHTTAHPDWTLDRCQAKALDLARKNEIFQTEILYESANGRLTRGGKWRRVEIVGVAADLTRSADRMFTFRCVRCKQLNRISSDRLIDAIAGCSDDVVFLADL